MEVSEYRRWFFYDIELTFYNVFFLFIYVYMYT